jgi:hypothetical protein
MPVPVTRPEFIALGWKYTNDGRCSRCHRAIEWWRSPRNKPSPMSVIEKLVDGQYTYTLQSHFVDCPFAAEFKKKKSKPAAAAKPEQRRIF